MSHELRTPLNSLLLLARLLADNPEQNLTAEADRVRPDHPQRRLRPAGADRRHPGPVQDRGRADGRRAGRGPLRRDPRLRRAGVRAAGRGEGPATCRSSSPTTCRRRCVTDAQRLQQILRNLLSNAVKFTDTGAVTLQIAPAAPDAVVRRAGADATPSRSSRSRVHRHRHRHLRRQAGAHLRGVPAGRRHDQPQVRRHRARPVDQPGAGPAARRRDHGGVRRPGRARRSPSTCRTCWPPDAVVGAAAAVAGAGAGAAAVAAAHAAARTLPEHGRQRRPTRQLDGATVLIVDDDVRNVFALTSALELHGMTRALRRQRRGRHPPAGRAPGGRHRADGRDDAGAGRLRDDPDDPAQPRASPTCRSSS